MYVPISIIIFYNSKFSSHLSGTTMSEYLCIYVRIHYLPYKVFNLIMLSDSNYIFATFAFYRFFNSMKFFHPVVELVFREPPSDFYSSFWMKFCFRIRRVTLFQLEQEIIILRNLYQFYFRSACLLRARYYLETDKFSLSCVISQE